MGKEPIDGWKRVGSVALIGTVFLALVLAGLWWKDRQAAAEPRPMDQPLPRP